MTSKFTFLVDILKKYRWYFIVLLILVLGFFIFNRGNSGNNRLVVTLGDVEEYVQVVGKTKAQENVNLGFNNSGRIAISNVKVGDEVTKGTVLSSLESAGLLADLQRAQSVLNEEKIRLAEISQNSPQSLIEAQEKVSQAIRQAYTLADNSVRNQTDKFFKNPRTNPKFEVVVVDNNYIHYFPVASDMALDINARRLLVETILQNWNQEIFVLDLSETQKQAQKSLSYLDTIGAFLDKVAFAVNSFEYADYSYANTVNGYKTSIESARNSVSTARLNLVNALQALSSSPVSINGSVSSVSIQEARVAQAESSIASIRANLAKSQIIAPFDGVVTKNNAFVGEVASVGAPLISLISKSDMYIEADVSEIKIGRVNVGNVVRITLDAFPRESFMGTVVFIEPGETMVSDVANYKIRVELSGPDSRMKSGLSANLSIRVDERYDIIVAPSYALIKEDKKYFVNKIINGKPIKTEVTIGLIGEDGNTEIVSGLKVGDEIVY